MADDDQVPPEPHDPPQPVVVPTSDIYGIVGENRRWRRTYGRTVHCLKCGTLIEEGESPDPMNPRLCANPECRSLERRVTFSAGSIPTTAVLGTATEVETAMPITPKRDYSRLKTTTVGVAAHSGEVRMTPPTDDLECWFVEVVRDGNVVRQRDWA